MSNTRLLRWVIIFNSGSWAGNGHMPMSWTKSQHILAHAVYFPAYARTILTAWWQRHVCMQAHQGCYMKVSSPGWTSLSVKSQTKHTTDRLLCQCVSCCPVRHGLKLTIHLVWQFAWHTWTQLPRDKIIGMLYLPASIYFKFLKISTKKHALMQPHPNF